MMNTLHSKTLAQIVNENHKAANVFEKYQLDFCCNGKRLLQQVCDESRLPINEVISEIETLGTESGLAVDPEKMSLTELAEYIVTTHHKYVKSEMPLIVTCIEKVASKHGGNHPEIAKAFDAFVELKRDMTEHMQKEELILFPRIRIAESQMSENEEITVNPSDIESPIAMMEGEHEHAGCILKQIRDLTNNYTLPADACSTYRLSFAALQAFEIDLHQHVHLENNVLFPKAMKLFGGLTPGVLS